MKDEDKQLHFDLGIDIPEQPTVPEVQQEQPKVPTVPEVAKNTLPAALMASADNSMALRSIQVELAKLITSPDYVAMMAASCPESIAPLMDSVTNGISVADNLLIQMARTSEKSASMQRVFDYMTKKQEGTQTKQIEQKDEYYDESVEKIKKSLYKKFDEIRNEHPRSSKDYINKDDDIIEAEYTDNSDKED